MTTTVPDQRFDPGRMPTGLWSELELLETAVDEVGPTGDPAGPDWVQAAPFRAHVRQLITDCGLPWRVIAVLAEVPTAAVRHLLHGRDGRVPNRLHPTIAKRLFSLTSAAVGDAAHRVRPAAETGRLLQSLTARGWSVEELSRRTGLPATDLQQITTGQRISCPQLTAAVVKAAAQALWDTPSPGSAGARLQSLPAAA